MNRLGEGIKKHRLLLGMSQRHLAKSLNCDHTFISHVEAGRKGISITSLLKLCRCLETTPNELLKYEK